MPTTTGTAAEDVITINHPLYIHHSDLPNYQLASKPLNGENFGHWKRSAEVALSARNKLAIVQGKYPKPASNSPILAQWERCNNTIISWILHSVEPDISDSIIYCESAQEMWEELTQRYGKASGQEFIKYKRRSLKLFKAHCL